MARRNYRHELTSVCFMSAVVACVDGGVIAVIADKAFDASEIEITILASAAALSHITSFLWARMLHGRDRVKMTVAMQAGVSACVLAIAAAPFNQTGVWVLLIGTLLARACVAGVITARGDLWRANYPRAERGRITGKLTILATIILSTVAVFVGWVMDRPWATPDAYRWIYVGFALLSVIGMYAFSRMRWRGRSAHLENERAQREDEDWLGGGTRAMLGVLRDDHEYRQYMVAMFLLGLPNVAAIPLFIVALGDRFDLDYTASMMLTQVLPVLVPVLVIPLWANLIDRVHVIRFRTYHSWSFVLANLLMGLGFVLQSYEVLFVARVALGVGFGGGMLAWNLGHNDFAKRDLATLYMGIHVTLTGVRGLIGPFIGLLLYSGLTVFPWLAQTSDGPAWQGFGEWTFFILAGVGVAGALLFLRMNIAHSRKARDA